MVQVKVEHVIVVLLGLFLLYHFMGNCGCNNVEGWVAMGYNDDQPYVIDTAYCGLEPAAEKFMDNAISDELEDYNADIRNLTGAQNNYNVAKGQYSYWKREYEDNALKYKTETNETTANTFLSNINQAANSANTAITDMMTASSDIANYTKSLNKSRDRLVKKREIKVAANDECSKPNRMLKRYKPDVACLGTGGSGSKIDPDKFSTLFLEDRNTFRSGVSRRQYDGEKNACKVLTAKTKDDYPFAPLLNAENKTFSGEDHWRNKITGAIPDAPNPIPVGSPMPTKYSRVNGPDYVQERDPTTFDKPPIS